MFGCSRLICFLATLCAVSPLATAFSFTAGPLSECDDLQITWTGGSAPFHLLMIPVFATPRNITIPSSAFSNGKGSYSMQLPFAKGNKILLTMSDATGFGSGGSTGVEVVQSSQGGSCNTTDPGTGFQFQLNSALTQCRPYVFSDYSDATQPVTIMGVIPSGTSFVLNPPVDDSDSYTWQTNIANGTSVIFFMTDSQGRQGGSSDVKTVGISDDNTCLNNVSPSSTSLGPSSTQSSPTSSGSNTSTASPSSGGVSIGAIAGTVIGGLLFLAIVITMSLFFFRRKREADGFAGSNMTRHSRRYQSEIDLNYAPDSIPNSNPFASASSVAIAPISSHYTQSHDRLPYDSDPFVDSLPPSHYPPHSQSVPSQYSQSDPSRYAPSQYGQSQYDQSSYDTSRYTSTGTLPPRSYPQSVVDRQPPELDPFNPSSQPPVPHATVEPFDSSSRNSMSAAQQKAGGIPAYKPSRYILHTDVEDAVPTMTEEVVELPPQYSERRAPLANTDFVQASAGNTASQGYTPSASVREQWHQQS